MRPLLFALCTSLAFNAVAEEDPLAPWRESVTVRPVAPASERHSIHAYFNTCPESPDGRYVLYYTSETATGEDGDLRILERSTGRETVLATGIVTEDAHRAACQQWSNNGRTVVYHNYKDGHWQVMAVDVETHKSRVLAMDHQVGFGSAIGQRVPVYGCHWDPGPHRDLELVNVVTGATRRAVAVAEVVKEYGEWIRNKFGTQEISLFFPVMSPDESRVFFKLARPGGGSDFRSSKASLRDGKVVYDLANGRFIRLMEFWGHPSWSPDSRAIFEYGNVSTDLESERTVRPAPSCISDHPSISPDGKLFVTDADVTKRKVGKPGDWGIAVGSMTKDDWVMLTVFGNSKGATSWRHNHPHPAFSDDGKRIYFNTNEGRWTVLKVAEQAEAEVPQRSLKH